MRHLLPVALLAALAGCDFIRQVNNTFTVTLENRTASPVHILKPGEDFDQANRLDQGGLRTIQFLVGEPGETITFRVGANGSVFQQVTCMITDDTSYPSVVYASNGTFCVDW
jgi:hypothetical protein